MPAAFFKAALPLLAIGALYAGASALAHDVQGHHSEQNGAHFLWGKRIGSNSDVQINCCLLYGSGGALGDCQPISMSTVEEVEGGYRFSDGEFVAASDVTLSPDGHAYRCKHKSQPSHCLFVTASRM